jgi:hypothetical protein
MARQIQREIDSEADADLANSDPEIWEHLFADGIVEGLKGYKSTGTAEETAAFRALYIQTRVVVDEALIPSDLSEASSVLEYQIPEVFVGITKKDKIVGAEILSDLKSVYMQHEDKEIRNLAKKVARKIEKLLASSSDNASVFSAASARVENPVFAGKTVVFTGTLSNMTRKEATDIATACGAHVVGSVSNNTDFLVAGEDAGSKVAKAAALGVTILSEQQWNDLAGRNATPGLLCNITVLRPFQFKRQP